MKGATRPSASRVNNESTVFADRFQESSGPSLLNTISQADGIRRFDEAKLGHLRTTIENDLQSNILLPDETLKKLFVFIRFSGGPAAARRLIRGLLSGLPLGADADALSIKITSHKAGQTLTSRPRANLLLTAQGYTALDCDVGSFQCRRFRQGARHSEVINRLHDPSVADWEPAYHRPWHALLVLSHDDLAAIERLREALVEYLYTTGVVSAGKASPHPFDSDIHIERGNLLNAGGLPSSSIDENFEIFGFRDGISQPVFLPEHWRHVQSEQYGGTEPLPGADPRSPLSSVLCEDPFAVSEEHAPAATSFGTFFVFRKLEQDYRGFEIRQAMYEAEVRHRSGYLRHLYGTKDDAAGTTEANPYAEKETSDSRRFVLKSLVGRNPSGEPISGGESSEESTVASRFNNFDFQNDRSGVRCPFSAHIRKANPRGETGHLESERRRRIVRRGIPYGSRNAAHDHLRPRAGLLFFCAQSDIEEQFEFIQDHWLNGRMRRQDLPTPGIDGLVGQPLPRGAREKRDFGYVSAFGRLEGSDLASRPEDQSDRRVRHGWIHQTVRIEFDFQDYVTLRGAEYLFAPSLQGLRRIAEARTEEDHDDTRDE